MFEPTIPFGEPELMRVSAFERYLHEPGGPRALGEVADSSLRGATLSPSLLADLSRFEGPAMRPRCWTCWPPACGIRSRS